MRNILLSKRQHRCMLSALACFLASGCLGCLHLAVVQQTELPSKQQTTDSENSLVKSEEKTFSKPTFPGITKNEPESGRFVKFDGGYMVPYKVTIPGTDVSFEMEPIPGGKFKFGSPESEEDRIGR